MKKVTVEITFKDNGVVDEQVVLDALEYFLVQEGIPEEIVDPDKNHASVHGVKVLKVE